MHCSAGSPVGLQHPACSAQSPVSAGVHNDSLPTFFLRPFFPPLASAPDTLAMLAPTSPAIAPPITLRREAPELRVFASSSKRSWSISILQKAFRNLQPGRRCPFWGQIDSIRGTSFAPMASSPRAAGLPGLRIASTARSSLPLAPSPAPSRRSVSRIGRNRTRIAPSPPLTGRSRSGSADCPRTTSRSYRPLDISDAIMTICMSIAGRSTRTKSSPIFVPIPRGLMCFAALQEERREPHRETLPIDNSVPRTPPCSSSRAHRPDRPMSQG